MVSKKAIIGIMVVALVAVIAIVAISGGSSDTSDARYNYDLELTDTFTTKEGFIDTAPSGMQWGIITYTAVNDRMSELSTNPLTWMWKLTANGIEYTDTLYTFDHPGYALKDVSKGETVSQTLVYSIPQDLKASDITVTEAYATIFAEYKTAQDKGIKVIKTTMDPQTFRYDYKVEFVSDTTFGTYNTPDSGMRHLKITYTVANDSVTDGVELGSYCCTFKVQYNGILYDADYTTSVPGYASGTVMIGGQTSSACGIDVPSSASLGDLVIVFEYDKFNKPLAVHDDSLL